MSLKDRFHILMMGAIDDELVPGEKAEFEKLKSSNKAFQKEFDQYKKLKEVTTEMRFSTPPLEIWDGYWLNIYNRMERGIGWLLFSIGSIILLTFGGFKLVEALLMDTSISWIFKAGVLFIMGGLAVLVVSVIRERWFTFKRDPYKEIVR
jgi:hypothetical protein